MKHNDMLASILADRRATRRDFLVGATSLGLSVAAASSLWSRRAHANAPQKGGHMIAALAGGSTTDQMNQQTWDGTVMIAVGRATRDSLVEVGQNNNVEPGLAESWEASDDATEWRFKLRSGVEFSNGKSLTADDVIASINVHRGENSASAAKGVFEAIEDVSADGDVIAVKLSGPNADFPFLMTDYHMNIVPAPDGKPDLVNGIGTGLYKVTDFEPGVRVTVERHPNAWQADQFGFVDTAEILSVIDPNARQSALVTGDVHAINRPDLKTIKLLSRKPDIEIVDVASNFFYAAPMLTDQEPYSSVDFRRALKYGIDRQQFVDKIIFGFGTPGNDHPIGPGFTYHAADIPQHSYDPDKAKHHLKKSGFEGITIDYSASDEAYPGAVDYAVLMKETLRPIGIDVNVVREPNDGYWSSVWNIKPFCAVYWGARPVEDMILSINYTSDAAWNDTRWGSSRVDELVIAARGELDAEKRADMYRDVQMIISQDGATLVPAYGRDVAAISTKVGTIGQYGGGWEMDGGHFIKRWWLKA